ncbi:gluconate:H+ symporter [[Pasteurella] aerogenes]
MPLVITAIAVVVLILLISLWKMNTFIALIIVSAGAALAFGIPVDKVATTIESGIGGTLGHIALIFGLGAMLGRLVADAGGAQRIALTLIDKFGTQKIQWAILIASFVVGVAMFFEVGLVLLIPIVFSVAREMKANPLYLGISMLSALLATHCFLPPHPGPTVIAGEYGADLGSVLIYGCIIALPIVVICGPMFTKIAKSIVHAAFEKTGDITALGTPKTFKDDEMPGFGISILTSMLPVILMMLATFTTGLFNKGSFVSNAINFIGNPSIAMLISILLAMYTMGVARNIPIKNIMGSLSSSITAIGMMLLIIGGGGAFKQVLIAGGVGNYIGSLFAGTSLSPIILAWGVAAILRIALGSATVAALSTAGLVVPILGAYDVNLALVTLATGAGSSIASHVNDAGFWMVKEYFGLTLKETFATWTLMSTILSILGLITLLILDMFI